MGRLPFVLVASLALAAPATAQPTPAPAPVQDPAQLRACLQRFAVAGLPRHRSENGTLEQRRPVICRRGYALSFNLRTLNPDWVIERLTPADLKGPASRSNHFLSDDLLGERGPRDSEYDKSGFDRGHQAPAGDAKFNQTVMDQSFYLSNISPQVGIGFNRGQWKFLEEEIRAWVLCGGRTDVIVMTGPIFGDGAATVAGRIRVPAAYYKIVYDVRSQRAVGFRLPNARLALGDVGKYAVPIAEIENETGLDFFPALPRRRQTQLEAAAGAVWGHGQACNSIGE